MLAKVLSYLPETKYRLWAVLSSLALGTLGAFLGLSISAAFLDMGKVFSLPGSFFIQSYGILAFIIPAYFLYAALVLADPQYRPRHLFFLCALVIPFFTLALGFYWIREFETVRSESSFIAGAGKLGIGFFTFIAFALEVTIIVFLYFLLFCRKPGLKNSSEDFSYRTEGREQGFDKDSNVKSQNLFDIYAKAAAAVPGNEPPSTPAFVSQTKAVFKNQSMEEAPEVLEELSDHNWSETPEPLSADADVEKALAEAAAFADAKADAIAAEETIRHKKTGFPEKVITPGKLTRRLPYSIPVEGILKQYPDGEYWIIDEETREAAIILKETFKEFNIQVEVTGIRKGPVITMFEILPAPGIRLAKIENLADNIALRLAAQSVRIVAPIPGKHAVGIEVPNAKRNIVSFREIIEGELKRKGEKCEIPIVLGKDITGEAVTVDLVQMPHLLIAGATGSGKSVCVNSMILTVLYQKPPSECRLILIDPKIVELKLYNDIPHLLTPVITEPKKAFQALQYCIYEMDRRYACLDSMRVRDIRSYNRRIKETGSAAGIHVAGNFAAEYMPYIVVVVDEYADLMATTGKELESTVARLAAKSRAVGIHLVLATQRPSIDVITGLIKANIPSRIAFMVAGRMNSQIIIDTPGAEKLLGKGDMLYSGAVDPFPIRMQGAFVSEEEVERVVDYVKGLGEPDYIDEEIFYDDEEENSGPSLFSDGNDPLYEKALEIVMQQGKASASYIQRRLKIGYNRSARLVEEMEYHGVVGPAQGSKPRELLHGT
ncbi:MAG: DNA translocase FtsK [Treponema sp.]|nr:DNA translocase FtsK [Treponema sp.]